MKELFINRSGSMYVMVLLLMSVLGFIVLLVTEFMRIHSIASHVETEINRAVNIAVEDAMSDVWRIDKQSVMDTSKAKEEFLSYLNKDLGLTGGFEMRDKNGSQLYRIQLSSMKATSTPPRLETSGSVFIRSIFSFILAETEVPFTIRSRNQRIN